MITAGFYLIFITASPSGEWFAGDYIDNKKYDTLSQCVSAGQKLGYHYTSDNKLVGKSFTCVEGTHE